MTNVYQFIKSLWIDPVVSVVASVKHFSAYLCCANSLEEVIAYRITVNPKCIPSRHILFLSLLMKVAYIEIGILNGQNFK